MKKLFLIGLIAAALTACNNESKTTENKKDSLDSVAREQKSMVDSTAEKKENRIDSLSEKKKDSLEKKDSMHREHRRDTTNKKY